MTSDTETDERSTAYESDNNNVAEDVVDSVTNKMLRVAHVVAKERLDAIAPKPRKRRLTTDVIYKVVENDGIFVGGLKDSVATILKNEALKLRPKYYNLEYNDRAIVALGLNSILDLTPQNKSSDPPPQKHLYNKEGWNQLLKLYQKTSSECNIISKYETTINEIETMARSDLKDARILAQKAEHNSTRTEQADLFSIYAHIFEFMEYHQYVFEKELDITENDFAIKLWGPVLEKLLRSTGLRCKWGESVGDSSEIMNSPSFKVDVRVIKDTLSRRKKEADKGNIELARRGCSLAKTSNDRTKLLIESKCVLDRLIMENENALAKNIAIPALQLSGEKARLYTLRLGGNGIYVGVKESGGSVPKSTSDIRAFRNVVMLLYKFKKATIDLMECNLVSKNDDDSDDSSNVGDKDSDGDHSWIRGTWIPPQDKKKSRIPEVPSIFVQSK